MRARSSLPQVSPRRPTLSHKRALRLEMLTKMIDDFHAKHGRSGHGKGKYSPANSAVSSTCSSVEKPSRTAAKEKAVVVDRAETGIQLPAIVDPASVSQGPKDPACCQRPLTSSEHTTDTHDGDGDSITVSAQAVHHCGCCGGKSGRGHGRRCEHRFRRCGLCRVEEVRRVLFGTKYKQGRGSDARGRGGKPVRHDINNGLHTRQLIMRSPVYYLSFCFIFVYRPRNQGGKA